MNSAMHDFPAGSDYSSNRVALIQTAARAPYRAQFLDM